MGQAQLSPSEAAVLKIGELVHNADEAASKAPGSGHRLLDEAAKHLPQVSETDRDNYTILVYSRHGRQYYTEGDLKRAIQAYETAINLAEVRIAQRCRGLYLMLQRYGECMCDIARVWIKSAAAAGVRSQSLRAKQIQEQEQKLMLMSSRSATLTSPPPSSPLVLSGNEDGGDVAMKEIVPGAQAQPDGGTAVRIPESGEAENGFSPTEPGLSPPPEGAVRAIAKQASTAFRKKRRDEATAEIVLLRCIETVEEGHNRRSDLLVEPLLLLASLYQSLNLFARAELLVRRAIGILIVQFGHDHPKLLESNSILEGLVANKATRLAERSATKIQATWKMHREMVKLGQRIHRTVVRHTELLGRKARTPTPPPDFLARLVGNEEFLSSKEESEPTLGTANGSHSLREDRNPLMSAAATAAALQTRSSSGSPNALASSGSLRKVSGADLPARAGRSPKAASRNSAAAPKSFRGALEPILSGEIAAPRIWSVPAEDGISPGDDGA